jgi:Family of unknown function (DUF6350)
LGPGTILARIGFVSVSAEAPPVPDPELPGSPDGSGSVPRTQPARPLVVTGGIAACAAAASGLAVLTTLTAIGWITAPHLGIGIGTGLGGVLRTAALLWLVGHHVGFTVRGAGRIGMLPLGLVLLPGALLAMAGRWVVRVGAVTRLRHVGYAALALALPYALLSGALAVASRTAVATPSLLQAVIAAFLLALVAGGLGAARGLAPWSRLVLLMPARPRSIVMGMLGAAAVLATVGAVLAGASLAVHLPEVKAASAALAPGLGGAALLLLAQLAYVPNAIIWAVAYTLGPGFAFGTGTVVAPTGSVLGAVPAFPMLAALPAGPRPGGPAWEPVLVLAMPYLAGICAGVVTIRVTPTPVLEAAPLWGFAAGAAAGALTGLAAAFSGGPLGDGRLAAVGPSGFQVGLVAILEVGVTAALAAAATNWLILRPRPTDPSRPVRVGPGGYGGVEPHHDRGVPGGRPPGLAQHDESDDAGGHRIYLNPWAGYDEDDTEPDDTEPDDRLPAALQDAELAADRVGELGVAGLLSRHRVRAAYAGVVGVQLRPEHRQHQQPQRAERQAEAAEHDAAGRAAGTGRPAAPGPPVRPAAEPDRRHPEQQRQRGHVDPAVQVAEPQRQPDQAERADGQRGQGMLAYGGIGRRQLLGRRQPPRLRPAPAWWLVSGHRTLLCPLRRPPGDVP